MKTYYKRYLPHLTPPGGIFFITTVLKGCLPSQVVKELKAEQFHIKQKLQIAQHQVLSETAYQEELIKERKLYFAKIDTLLDDSVHSEHYLKNIAVVNILANKFKQYDGLYYRLEAYCIMSNHFHLLIDTSLQLDKLGEDIEPNDENYTPLSKIMNLIKGGSAYEINQYLGRKGVLWQRESYDHLVRDEAEHHNIHQYILDNPVKAGFVKHWKDYPFNYTKSIPP